MNLNLRPANECKFDEVSLGEVMLRLDPGEGRIRTARSFRAWEGGGEYNVARGLSKCFKMNTGIITAFADNEVGMLMEDFINQGGVDTSLIRWMKTDGIGRICRNGLNFTERGFGIRGAVGCSDRANTAISKATPEDFDFERQTLSITKSYQRLKGQDVISAPKTEKSVRIIKMPSFLCDEVRDLIRMSYQIKSGDRLFPVTKYYLHHEMNRGTEKAGIKRIRIHDLRHSHVSLLIDMGFSAVAIADRVGHESIDITYQYAHLFPSKQIEMAEKLDDLGKGDFENVS